MVNNIKNILSRDAILQFQRFLAGILAQESGRHDRHDFDDSYVRSTYVDWVKMAGGRAVPIW